MLYHIQYFCCTTADTNDFDSKALTVTFLADEGMERIMKWPAPIPVTDDEIEEADQQFFIVQLVLAHTDSPFQSLTIGRDTSNCIITDSDCK